ncbi:hypothetical protein [Clostridium beijerinckii]|uniref:hypothetical protein n=1 Tax=Clostridium beijerinckii TaxID=1520 RepID=UPI0022E6D7F3|nr:hypothetical protein [Clostridium beijerinckii]
MGSNMNNQENDFDNVNDEADNEFIGIYNLFQKNNIDEKIEQVIKLKCINNNREKKILERIFLKYSFYEKYIPLSSLGLFVDFVDCYLLGKEEECNWKCHYIANILAGMDFYNTEFEGSSIISFLYELAEGLRNEIYQYVNEIYQYVSE